MKWAQTDGLTRILGVEYRINYFRTREDGGLGERAEPPYDGAEHIECAMRALAQIEALFAVLSFVEGSGLHDGEGGPEALLHVGELGQLLASAAHSRVIEAEACMERAQRERGRGLPALSPAKGSRGR